MFNTLAVCQVTLSYANGFVLREYGVTFVKFKQVGHGTFSPLNETFTLQNLTLGKMSVAFEITSTFIKLLNVSGRITCKRI